MVLVIQDNKKEKKTKQKTKSRILKYLLVLAIIFLAFYLPLKIFAFFYQNPAFSIFENNKSVVILDRFERFIAETKNQDDNFSTYLKLSEVPKTYIDMLLLSEDKRFYYHFGVDPLSIFRAMLQNFRQQKIVSGGSTITQQLARTLLDKREKTVNRKIKEIALAIILELKYSKKQILAAYLNRVYFGYQNSSLKSASFFYFGKGVKELSLTEQAYLIIVLKSPAFYNPILAKENIWARSKILLKNSLDAKIISRGQYLEAIKEKPIAKKHYHKNQMPHFVQFLKNKEENLFNQKIVKTTIDLEIQKMAEKIVKEEIAKLSNKNVKNAAVLVLKNDTREIIAYLGSQDFFAEKSLGQNDGVLTKRQPGSAIKPFVYAYALDSGFTPATILPDRETQYFSHGGYFVPHNYAKNYLGEVSFRLALGNSLNLPTLHLASSLYLPNLLNKLRLLGISSLDQDHKHYGIGIALGNADITLMELAQAFLVFPNLGKYQPVQYLLSDDKQAIEPISIFKPTTAYIINHILSDNDAREISFGRNSVLRQAFPSAVKTGTSTNYRDNWCMGYTPDYLVAVWVGNFDSTYMHGVSGISGAGIIWNRIIKELNKGQRKQFIKPREIVQKTICLDTGLLASSYCQRTKEEIFSQEMALKSCDSSKHSYNSAKKNITTQKTNHKPIMISYPVHNTFFALDPRIERKRQIIEITYQASIDFEKIDFFVNDQKLNNNTWQIERGSHIIKVKAYKNNLNYEDSVKIYVF